MSTASASPSIATAASPGTQQTTEQAAADAPVVVNETETTTTYANPDGTMTLQAAPAPIHVRRDGTWVDVDTDLVESGGVVAPKASVADVSFSDGGSGPVATLASGSMVYSLDWLSGLPTPSISGDTATYADVAPGIDLVLKATRLGYEQFFVIRRRPTKPVGTLRLPVHLSGGLALSQQDDGTLQLRDADGTLLAQAAQPRMWDATTDPHTGNPTHSAVVDVALVTTKNGGQELDVTPAEGFLDDPAVTYPVTVDPSANLTRQGDTWVQSSIHNTPQAGSTELRAGTYDGGSTVARSYIDFAISPVYGKVIDSATLKLYNFHSWSCTAAPVNIDPLASGFDGTTTWDNKPSRVTGYRVSKSFAHGYSSACPAGYSIIDVTSIMRAWTSGTLTDYGLMVSASESDSTGWKKFNSANAADNVPLMIVDYEDCGTYSGYKVCGPILDKYKDLGGASSFLGDPTEDTQDIPGGGQYQFFEGGEIEYSAATGAHVMSGPILGKYNDLGGSHSFLGFPTNDTQDIPEGGQYQFFEGGEIEYSAATGAHVMSGPILDKYNGLGGSHSFLGFPTNDTQDIPGGGQYQFFEGGEIEYSAATGAHYIRGNIMDKYNGLGGSWSALGFPTTDEYAVTAGVRNDFGGGFVYDQTGRGITLARLNPTRLADGDESFYSYETRKLSDRVTLKVNRASGDALLELTDLSLQGRVNSLAIGHAYNSLAVADSPISPSGAGIGWTTSTAPGMRLRRSGTEPNTTVHYYDPSGHDYVFTQTTATGFARPAGVDATLTVDAGNSYTLTMHQSQEEYLFSDDTGALQSDSDRNSNMVEFSRPSATELDITGTRGTDPGDKVVATLDGSGLLTGYTQSDGNGGSRGTSYGYNAAGDLTDVHDAAGAHWQFGYDDLHNLTTITGPQANPVFTKLSYDGFGRVTQIVQDAGGPDEATTGISYDDDTDTVSITDPDGHPASKYVHDDQARITEAHDQLGNKVSADYAGSLDNRPMHVTNASLGTTDYAYKNNGESLISTQGPLGALSSSEYDNTDPATQYLPSSSTDTMGNQTHYTYAGPGNLTDTSSGTGAQAGTAHLDYNADGTVHASTTPKNMATSNASTYAYDTAGNLKTITPPPTGHGNLAPQQFTYDGYGRLKTTTTGNGVTITYGYDEDDRTTSISYSDNTPDVHFTYDEAGNVTLRTDAAGDTTYGYDHLNRLTNKSGTAVPGGPLSYSYDDAGNLRTLTDGRGTTKYDYNAANELTTLTEGKTGRTDKFAYNADHQRTDTWYDTGGTATPPTSFAGHIHVSFDTANRLTEIKTTTGSSDADGARVADLSYSYTATINGVPTDTNVRQSVTDHLTGATTSYGYDSRARLTSATDTNGPDYSYGYDADGNLVSGSAGSHTYNAVDQLTDTGTSYDADGNRTASPGSNPALTALTYTGADQTASITTGSGTTDYGYAGADQNELVTAGSRQLTQGSTGVQAQTNSGVATYFERAPDGTLIAEQTPDGSEFYYYFDGLGSVIGLIDTTGTKAATYTYDPYGGHPAVGAGNYPDTSVAEANPYRYAGGYRDAASGLYKFGARYYDPTIGRWTQPDPQRRLLDLQQGNLYAYAGDNPSNNLDPSGLLFGSVLKVLDQIDLGLDTLGVAALPVYAGFVIGGIAAPIVGIFAGLAILAAGGFVLYEVISNGA